MDLAMTLRAVVSQRLVRREDGRRMAAVEVMLNTPYVEELILNRRIDELPEAMRQSTKDGMQTFEEALFRLYKRGRISREEALGHADSPTNLEARINFGG
jgi:twitching motility protein PilU